LICLLLDATLFSKALHQNGAESHKAIVRLDTVDLLATGNMVAVLKQVRTLSCDNDMTTSVSWLEHVLIT